MFLRPASTENCKLKLVAYHDIRSTRAAKAYEGSPGRTPGNRIGSRAAALAKLVAVLVLYVSVRLVRG